MGSTEIIPGEIDETERWLPVVGYEHRYMVSSFGRVARIMKCRNDSNGYRTAALTMTTYDQKMFLVHGLVANAFIGERPSGMHINHKDGVKSNNSATNLEYVTRSENIQHAVRTGLITVGENHHAAKLCDVDVLSIKFLGFRSLISQSRIAAIFGISQTTVSAILTGKIRRNVHSVNLDILATMEMPNVSL